MELIGKIMQSLEKARDKEISKAISKHKMAIERSFIVHVVVVMLFLFMAWEFSGVATIFHGESSLISSISWLSVFFCVVLINSSILHHIQYRHKLIRNSDMSLSEEDYMRMVTAYYEMEVYHSDFPEKHDHPPKIKDLTYIISLYHHKNKGNE